MTAVTCPIKHRSDAAREKCPGCNPVQPLAPALLAADTRDPSWNIGLNPKGRRKAIHAWEAMPGDVVVSRRWRGKVVVASVEHIGGGDVVLHDYLGYSGAAALVPQRVPANEGLNVVAVENMAGHRLD